MKSIKKLFSTAIVAASFLVATSFSANAAVIKQDILSGDGTVLGQIAVELDNAALNTGLNDSAFDDTMSLVSINLLGLAPWLTDLDVYNFEVAIDTDFVENGIEFFAIDADDIGFDESDTWSYQLIFDAFDLNASFIDVFTFAGDVVFFDFITLGDVEVTGLPVVEASAPATVAIFSLALAGLYGRRKFLS